MKSQNLSFTSWLLVAILVLLPTAHSQAQPARSACDPAIEQNLDHPQGYRDRDGQLCEGLYATEVSSLGLTLASFTGPLHGIDLARHAELRFHWQEVGKGEVRIRADSLRPRFYYRMDAIRPSNEKHLSWSNAIPALNELRTSELGVLATLSDSSLAVGELVYLPLHISQGAQITPVTPYVVTVISGAEIEEISWSLARDGAEGFIVYDKDLDLKPYPAGEPINIELDRVGAPGLYRLTISSKLRSGLPDLVEILFYHSD